MELLLYLLARTVIAVLQILPLGVVARVGRVAGGLVYLADARHRRVARENLRRAFPEKSEGEIRTLARENFRRIGENFSCAAKTAGMDETEIRQILEVTGVEKFSKVAATAKAPSIVVAIGHFGNFELYARAN